MTKTTADYLNEVADLLEGEGKWTQHCFARGKSGKEVHPLGKHAVCWCMAGAVQRVAPREAWPDLGDVLCDVTGHSIYSLWQDQPGRTQSEVVAACRKAAELARAGQ